ncbi:AfsR/SARP family transcriptional regulator [Actinoallomurus iriomotensis]|uniref:SARP family transcriptional regulator n=1 Tax=Actinoallomurus iriomotensis TaxID=478107 RepID=A0A9W6S5J5_9ACTN|nr:AfsR/SARP family transcriptional regulator [Actinoallomurus iriomotensis]GLY86027.1 SARP family transcriptional regulator [Actinoallomurus iriomotensis]
MEYRVLGRIDIISAGGELVPVTRPLVRGALFALVLHRNEPLSRERLIDLLWGEGPGPVDRLHSLRDCLWNLRRLLPPQRLVADERGHRLDIVAGRDRVDVERFRQLVREAARTGDDLTAAHLLQDAVGLWGSGRLSELLPATAAMTALVTGLAEEHRGARNALIQVRLRLGQHWDLLPELRAWVSAEPVDEQLWADLMLALYRCGLKTDALGAFTEAREALSTAGLAPGNQLHRLHRQMQVDDPKLSPEVEGSHPSLLAGALADHRAKRQIRPRQLPPDTLNFTGRGTQAAELIALLSPKPGSLGVPLAEVTGPPGIGKTALAVHVAHAIAHDYPDGQLFLRLGGASDDPARPEEALAEVLRAVGMSPVEVPETRAEREAAYRTHLAGRRLLLVLDDAASPDQVRPLLPGTAGSAVIVTSQRQLVGLAAGQAVNLAPFAVDEAMALLAQIVGRPRMEAEPIAADEVVAACGGLPLAVRIAGERLAARPNWPIAYLARALRDEQRRLDELVAGDLAVRASLALSYRTLPPRLQRLFRLLPLAGAGELPGWAADRLVGEPATDAVEVLVDRSLLCAEGMDVLGQPRYRMHDLIRTYATELQTGPDGAVDDTEAAQARLIDGWLELAALADAQLPQPRYLPPRQPASETAQMPEQLRHMVIAEPERWFTTERENLLATIHSSCAIGQHRTAGRLAQYLAAFLHVNGYHDDAENAWTAITRAAELAGDHDAACNARLRTVLVMVADKKHTARAAEPLRTCLAAFEAGGHLPRLALTYAVRGFCAYLEGDHDQAHGDADRGLELARQAGDTHAEFLCLYVLGVTFNERGDYQQGIGCGERAVKVAEQLGPGYTGTALYALIQSHAAAGQPAQVIQLCRHGLVTEAPTGHSISRAFFRQHLGLAYQQLGEHDQAITTLTTAAEQFHTQRNYDQQARCLLALADSYYAMGCWHEVSSRLEKSIVLFRKCGSRSQEVKAQEKLGALRQGHAS